MAPTPEPEILRPRVARGADMFSDRNLDLLSHILDDFLRIPGTQIRFGLDGVIGLIPGVGDVLGAMASWIIILAAWMRGVPRVTLARMMANVAIDAIVGAVPILGDVFDVAWKANRRNFELLERSVGAVPSYGTADAYNVTADSAHGYGAQALPHRASTAKQRKRHAASDWIFLVLLVLCMMALLAFPLLFLAYLLGRFFAMGAHHA